MCKHCFICKDRGLKFCTYCGNRFLTALEEAIKKVTHAR